jgi:hypothetical protein
VSKGGSWAILVVTLRKEYWSEYREALEEEHELGNEEIVNEFIADLPYSAFNYRELKNSSGQTLIFNSEARARKFLFTRDHRIKSSNKRLIRTTSPYFEIQIVKIPVHVVEVSNWQKFSTAPEDRASLN